MEKRQRFFQQQFSLDMNRVKDKILSIKDQADDLEARLDAVDEKEDSLTKLDELEREARPSFFVYRRKYGQKSSKKLC